MNHDDKTKLISYRIDVVVGMWAKKEIWIFFLKSTQVLNWSVLEEKQRQEFIYYLLLMDHECKIIF